MSSVPPARASDVPKRNARCSFCRKNNRDVGPLVEGPGDVYICGECIALCGSILGAGEAPPCQDQGRALFPEHRCSAGDAGRVPRWQRRSEAVASFARPCALRPAAGRSGKGAGFRFTRDENSPHGTFFE